MFDAKIARMDMIALEIFSEVAQQGSFAVVARRRDRDASFVSRTVSALEGELGLRLFQRTTRRVELTEAGQIFLQRVEPLLVGMAEARAAAMAVSSTPAGHLRMTCSVSFGQQCLVPLLAEFRSRFPQISLDLVVTDANLDLVAERIDLAVRLGSRPVEDFISTKIMDTSYLVCASPQYLAQQAPVRTPADLGGHKCLIMPVPGFSSRWLFKGGEAGSDAQPENLAPHEVAVKGDIIISNAMVVRDAAIAGLGPALLPHWLVGSALASGRLVDLFPQYQASPTITNPGVWLVYPSRAFLAQKVRVAIDFFKTKLKQGAG